MSEFITTNEKTYHKFRDCKWLEKIPESKRIPSENILTLQSNNLVVLVQIGQIL